jgi:hypothetical protein
MEWGSWGYTIWKVTATVLLVCFELGIQGAIEQLSSEVLPPKVMLSMA